MGKTALVEQLFSTGFEIINADSQQVYKYLSIGTAKPSAELIKKIPHHLIGFLSPKLQFSVGCFVAEADRAVVNILRRGHVPVITGGTAFYFYHFMYGMPTAPRADDSVRREILRRFKAEGRSALWRELEEVDPVRAAQLHPNDTQRLLRALEVFYSEGRPLSSYHPKGQQRSAYRYFTVGLNRDRQELYRRINERVEVMWKSGLPEEFHSLIEMGFTADDPGMKGIGYREFFIHRDSSDISTVDVKQEIQKNSRRYAKRQITFFKRIPGVEWFHPDQKTDLKQRTLEFLHLK